MNVCSKKRVSFTQRLAVMEYYGIFRQEKPPRTNFPEKASDVTEYDTNVFMDRCKREETAHLLCHLDYMLMSFVFIGTPTIFEMASAKKIRVTLKFSELELPFVQLHRKWEVH